jgi:hypothetical protein
MSRNRSLTPRAPRVAALENRVAELNGTVGDLARKPVIDVTRHEADLKALETRQETIQQDITERLAALELSAEERQLLPDLASLDTRIEALEISIAELSGLLSPPVDAAPVALLSGENSENGVGGKGNKDESPLPFEVVDVEVRGGAHFVVIGNGEKVPRILYPGDVEGGWRLDGIDERTAIFRHGESTRHVALP